MRYNEKELQALSRQPAELAAELGMRGPKKGSGEWDRGCEPGTGRAGVPVGAGWAVAEPARARPVSTVVKRRLVKLVVNFLFYFRTDEDEVGRREGGPRAGVGSWGPRMARPSGSSAPSPSELSCWSTAESPRKSPAASPSVSAGGGDQAGGDPSSALTLSVDERSPPFRAGLRFSPLPPPRPPGFSFLLASTVLSGCLYCEPGGTRSQCPAGDPRGLS